MANKLIREVVKTYIPGTPGTPGTPAYCYTRTIQTRVPGSAGSTTSDFISIDDLEANSGVQINGFAVPVLRQLATPDPLTGAAQEIIDYRVLRGAPSSPTYTTSTEQVCVPAVPAVQGTPSQVIAEGAGPDWRASARSIDTIVGDGLASFTLNPEPRLIVGFGVTDTGANQGDIEMGARFATENGVTVITPMLDAVQQSNVGTYTAGDVITLLRVHARFKILQNGAVIYDAPSETEEPVFLDAMLYTSSDYVDGPALGDATTITASGSVGLTANTFGDATGSFGVTGSVGFTGTIGVTEVLGEAVQQGAALTMTPIGMLASDTETSTANLVMTPLTTEGFGGGGQIVVAGANLTFAPMSMSSLMFTGGVITSSTTMASMDLVASDQPYGAAKMTMRRMAMYADDGFGVANYYGHNEPVQLADILLCDPILIASWGDGLGLEPEFSIAAVLSGSIFEGLLLDPQLSLQSFVTALVESGVTLSSATQMPRPDLAQFAFDINTGAATRYEGFEFRDFVRTSQGTFAVKKDGLYKLRKGDDAGEDRSALLDFGEVSFGSSAQKYISTMYPVRQA
mgnify:CR=1 FL=1